MLTNLKRMELVKRLNDLTKEASEIAQILANNPCPVTDEDIDRGVKALIDQRSRLYMASLDRHLREGMSPYVVATYYPNAPRGQQLKAYSQEVSAETLLVFQRLIDSGHYRIEEGDENLDAYVMMLEPSEDPKQSNGTHELIMTEEEPAGQILVQIGPRQKIRLKVSEETLAQHLEMAGLTRPDMEKLVGDKVNAIADNEIWYVHAVEKRKSAD